MPPVGTSRCRPRPSTPRCHERSLVGGTEGCPRTGTPRSVRSRLRMVDSSSSLGMAMTRYLSFGYSIRPSPRNVVRMVSSSSRRTGYSRMIFGRRPLDLDAVTVLDPVDRAAQEVHHRQHRQQVDGLEDEERNGSRGGHQGVLSCRSAGEAPGGELGLARSTRSTASWVRTHSTRSGTPSRRSRPRPGTRARTPSGSCRRSSAGCRRIRNRPVSSGSMSRPSSFASSVATSRTETGRPVPTLRAIPLAELSAQ